jgi:hypothetical protein
MKPANKRQQVPLIASHHWHYLHQDGKKTWNYNKYSKATICRHMKRKIDDSVIDKRKQRPPSKANKTRQTQHLTIRLKFAKQVRNRLKNVSFYLDGVGFTHKYNPHDQLLAPRTMAWRKPSDGLSHNQTSKGSHEGSGGRTANFFVAIAHIIKELFWLNNTKDT